MSPLSPQPNFLNREFSARDYLRIFRNRLPVIALTFVVILCTAIGVTMLKPKEYLGRAAVEILQNDDDLRVFSGASESQTTPSLNFLQTQFEVISSQQTLYRVIDEHDLVAKWNAASRADAYAFFLAHLETSARRNTNLIDIEVYAADPEDAADLANAVADSYAARRLESDRQRIDNGLTALNEQVNKQRTRVANLRADMLRLMRENDIVDFDANRETSTSAPTVLMNSEQRLYDLKREIAGLTTQIERFNQLSGDELVKMAISLDVADVSVQQVYPKYLDQSIALERMRNLGLGAKHPKVLAAQQEIAKMTEFLQSGVATIRETLSTQLQIAQDSLTRIEQLHDDKKDQSMTEREDYVAYSQVKNEFDTQNLILQRMEANYHEAMVDQNLTSTPIRIHERAEPSATPARPNIPLNIAFGVVIGLVFGLGLALVLEYLDNGVKTLEQVEAAIEAPVLAVVPEKVGLLKATGTDSPDSEAYRILRTGIEMHRPRPEANVITAVSGSPGEGKSTTLANLATICADGGYTTLLIDADMRRPQMHSHFDIKNVTGLSAFLNKERPLDQCVGRALQQNLWVMPSGRTPRDPSGLLNSAMFTELLAEARARFDIVLIDSPPILGVSDSAILCREADMTIAVVQHNKLPEPMLYRVRQAIEAAGGNLLGAVLNNVKITSNRQYQYYTSYYGYYDNPKIEAKTPIRSVNLPGKPKTA